MNFKPKALGNQVMVITGATSGIGLATARMAAKSGAKLILNSRHEKELKNLITEIKKANGQAVAVAGDIADLSTSERIRDEGIKAFGTIDTWVNNAGVSIYGELIDGNFEDERKLFDINFWGTRMACQVAALLFKEKGGTIINIGSELSEMSPSVLGIYAASKHALKAFTDSLRVELQLKELPVNVCLIRPTSIATPMPEHGKDQLAEGEPSLPSPLYHPNVVATMILRCAVNPQRDIYVGIQAKLSALSSTIFPPFNDLVARYRSKAITQGMSSPHQVEQENLEGPSRSEGKVLGHFKRLVLKRSLYSDLTTLGVAGTIRTYLSNEKQ